MRVLLNGEDEEQQERDGQSDVCAYSKHLPVDDLHSGGASENIVDVRG